MELNFCQLGEWHGVRFEHLRHDLDIAEVQGQGDEGQPKKKSE